jgi:hypothetical protein
MDGFEDGVLNSVPGIVVEKQTDEVEVDSGMKFARENTE